MTPGERRACALELRHAINEMAVRYGEAALEFVPSIGRGDHDKWRRAYHRRLNALMWLTRALERLAVTSGE